MNKTYSMRNIDIKHEKISIDKLSKPNTFINFQNLTNLKDNFQKTFLWDPISESHFIEKFLLGLPIPYINVFREDDNHCEILKNWEYLYILYKYLTDNFVLENIKFLPEINHKSFSNLPNNIRRKFLERDISFYILQNNLLVDRESLKTIKEMMY